MVRTIDVCFCQVRSDLKKGMVKDVFSSVAHNYDVMNDLMSAGKHRRYLRS